MSMSDQRRRVKSTTFSALLEEVFSIQEQILAHERFQDVPVLTSRTKTYKEVCEVLSQQLQVVLESAVAPPETQIYSEVEMKNMTRVLQNLLEGTMQASAKTQQVSSALFNKDMVLVTTLTAVKPNADSYQRLSSQLANSRSMRDFTHVLETEVLPSLSHHKSQTLQSLAADRMRGTNQESGRRDQGFVSAQKQRDLPNLDWQVEQRMQQSSLTTRNVTPLGSKLGSTMGSAIDPAVPLSQKLQDYKNQNQELANKFKQLQNQRGSTNCFNDEPDRDTISQTPGYRNDGMGPSAPLSPSAMSARLHHSTK